MTAKCTCIDFSSSIIRLPATHSGWSDFWDVGLAINERRRGSFGVQEKRKKKEPCPCLKGKAQTERNSRGTGDPAC